MPRTKVQKKRRVTNDNISSDVSEVGDIKKKDTNMLIAEINAAFEDKINQYNHIHKNQLKNMMNTFNVLRLRLESKGVANKTLGEIMAMDEIDYSDASGKENKNEINPQFSKSKVQRSVRKRSNSCNTRSTSKKTNSVRSSSCDRNPPSASKFKTPSNRNIPQMPFVTPKVNPNIPLSVLRRPRQGEFAMSISGSPLMVSSVTYDEMASVSVPLPDGRVLSILPTEGITAANLNLDEETRRQLVKLRSNLTKCLGK